MWEEVWWLIREMDSLIFSKALCVVCMGMVESTDIDSLASFKLNFCPCNFALCLQVWLRCAYDVYSVLSGCAGILHCIVTVMFSSQRQVDVWAIRMYAWNMLDVSQMRIVSLYSLKFASDCNE